MVAPVLGLLLVGAADFARAFYFNQEVIASARAGAQYGSQTVGNAADSTGIKAAAVANAINIPGFAASNVTTSTCTCSPPSGVTACASSYCNGANSQATYVTVISTATFTTLVHYPGVPQTTSMSATAIMQVENSGQNGS
jgi:hypothetical protein